MNIDETQEFGKNLQFAINYITVCQNKCRVLRGEDDKLTKEDEKCLSIPLKYIFRAMCCPHNIITSLRRKQTDHPLICKKTSILKHLHSCKIHPLLLIIYFKSMNPAQFDNDTDKNAYFLKYDQMEDYLKAASNKFKLGNLSDQFNSKASRPPNDFDSTIQFDHTVNL
jgi:hypothetical protein